MRRLTLALVIILGATPALAQDCERSHDEFDQETMFTCSPVDATHLDDPNDSETLVWGYWSKKWDDYGIGVAIPLGSSEFGDALLDERADLIIDQWRGAWPLRSDYDDGTLKVYLVLREGEGHDLVRRIARAKKVKIRVGGIPLDISAVSAHMARLMEIATDSPSSVEDTTQAVTGDTQAEADAPYVIEGLDRDPERAPLPRYTEKVNARIQVQITVNPEGRIVRRIPLKNGSPKLEAAVMDALQQWRFNALPPGASQENQTGTITFTFRLDSEERSDSKPDTTAGRLLHCVQPDYPAAAREEGTRARIEVEVQVARTGRVQAPTIRRRWRLPADSPPQPVSEIGDGIEEAVLQAARRCRFRPTRVNGSPVPTREVIKFEFDPD